MTVITIGGVVCAALLAVLASYAHQRISLLSDIVAERDQTISALQLELLDVRAAAASTAGDGSRFSLDDIENAGQLFFARKVSEILMPEEVQNMLQFDNATWGKEQYMTGLGLTLITEPKPNVDDGNAAVEYFNSRLVARMDRYGAVVVNSVVDRAACKLLAQNVYAELWEPQYDFGRIQEPEYRKDYPLRLNARTLPVFKSVLSMLYPALRTLLGGDATLVEFSSITSFAGSGKQQRHPDSNMQEPEDIAQLQRIFSIFVYLDDIEEDMAALDVWPGTHTHFHFLDPGEMEMLQSAPSVRLAVPAGTIVMYDSRLLHRGSANTNTRNRVRPAMMFSFASASGKIPVGPTYSIRGEYAKANLTLDELYYETRELPGVPPSSPSHEKCMKWADANCGANWRTDIDVGNECHDRVSGFIMLRQLSPEAWLERMKVEAIADGSEDAINACYNSHIQKEFGWGLFGRSDLYMSARASWGGILDDYE